jgi:hypothetical protein
LLTLTVMVVRGQEVDKMPGIKIGGLTLDESGVVVPQVGIYSFKFQSGSTSDSHGAFSIISTPGDTVLFTLQGYRPTLLTIPMDLPSTKYFTDVYIVKDTITIEEVTVFPFKTYIEFKEDVTKAKTISPETENMNFNISLVRQQLYYNLGATPGEGYRFTIQQMAYDAYTKGQLH